MATGVWQNLLSVVDKKENTLNFTIATTSEFDFDMLPRFAKDHRVTYTVGFDEGYTVTFWSSNRDYLEEARDQLSDLVIEDI